MINFTPDINLGNTVVTGAIGLIGLGLRALYKLVSSAIDRHDQAMDDVADHAEVLNLHTSIIKKAGLSQGRQIPIVAERRKKDRRAYFESEPL